MVDKKFDTINDYGIKKIKTDLNEPMEEELKWI